MYLFHFAYYSKVKHLADILPGLGLYNRVTHRTFVHETLMKDLGHAKLISHACCLKSPPRVTINNKTGKHVGYNRRCS